MTVIISYIYCAYVTT